MSSGLRFAGAGRSWGRRVALRALDLECGPGTMTCLVGPNGAGKSTALSLAAGLIAATEGSVIWNGRRLRPETAPPDTGFLPQASSFHRSFKVAEIVDFAAAARGVAHAERDRMLAVAGLAPAAQRFVGQLSGGWVRRLGLLCALLGSPALLLLDEPFVGLDPETHDRLLAELRSRLAAGATLVVASHDFEVVDVFAPRVAVLDEGRLLTVSRVGNGRGGDPAVPSSRVAYRGAFGAVPARSGRLAEAGKR